MKPDVTFVTCIYDDLSTTPFSGRHNRGTHDVFSLAQIHELGVPIYVYTDKQNFHRNFPAFLRFGHSNFNFINYNLDEYPNYKKIQDVKQAHPEIYDTLGWQTRCVEIMWGKFDWILDVISRIGIAPNKYLYWIDAGLSHGGVLPKRFNSRREGVEFKTASHEYSHMFSYDLCFNEDLPTYLIDCAGEGNLFHFFCTQPQHNDPSHLKVNKTHIGTAVGGLFGGDIGLLYEWATECKAVCDDLLVNGYILKEEDIMSYLLNVHAIQEDSIFKDRIYLYKFDTWYHEDWEGAFKPGQHKSFSQFFDEFQTFRNIG